MYSTSQLHAMVKTASIDEHICHINFRKNCAIELPDRSEVVNLSVVQRRTAGGDVLKISIYLNKY